MNAATPGIAEDFADTPSSRVNTFAAADLRWWLSYKAPTGTRQPSARPTPHHLSSAPAGIEPRSAKAGRLAASVPLHAHVIGHEGKRLVVQLEDGRQILVAA